jgi:hypothetical protein
MVDKVVMGQIYVRVFAFHLSVSFHRVSHTHISEG